MEYIFEIRRIERKPKYESWLMYTSDGNRDISTDCVYLFFEGNNCKVFLFMENKQLLDIEKYSATLESIYHDVGISESDELLHELNVVEIPKEMLNDDDKVEAFINKVLENEIKKFQNS